MNKNIRKYISCMLTLTLLLILFTSCSKEKATKITEKARREETTETGFNPESNYDYQYFNSIEEIANDGNLIIEGEVVSDDGLQSINTSLTEQEIYFDYYVYTIKIDNIIEGEYSEENIQIKIHNDDFEAVIPKVGEKGIFFLETYDNVPASLLNPQQALLEIKDDKVVITEEVSDLFNEEDKIQSRSGNTVPNEVPVEDVINQIKNR